VRSAFHVTRQDVRNRLPLAQRRVQRVHGRFHFMRAHPKLNIELNFDDRYMNLVERGIDVAIRMGRLADSSLGATYLGLNPWMLVASADYLATRGTPLQPADLATHDALIYSTVQGDARWEFSGTSVNKKSARPKSQLQTVVAKGPLRSNNLSALLAAERLRPTQSLKVLHLLAKLLYRHLHFHRDVGQLQRRCFRSHGVGFAQQFLNQKVQALADFTANFQ
jgi:DNA-binding transcriptional LysR family regulator